MAVAQRISPAVAAPAAPETGSTLTVDLAAITANWRMLADRLLAAECAAVVKANAYGLGLPQVTTVLAKAGCKTFFVADLAEARVVRSRAPDAAIYILHGFTPDWGEGLLEINARPVINSATELAEWDAFVAAHSWRGGAALQVDTGMRRLGISADEAVALAPRAQTENHGIALLMSHLVCAEIADHPLNAKQIRLFRELHTLYPGVPASLVNSSGIFLGDAGHFDLARPGAALYGVNPTPGRPNPMKSAVELSSRILQIRSVARDDTVGYDATWTAKRTSRIAVIALGYADGLMRGGGGTDERPGGAAIVAGRRCPIVGRISMDLVCADVTDLPDGAVHRGDQAVLIGGEIGLDEAAAAAGTIGYEVLTRLGLRSHVVYRSDQDE
ncbi:MAG TPA: alanine racemase [Xanthobacteraceae bacterium]|nr:alanine racemase [Xanthobacteraceae bacterium]